LKIQIRINTGFVSEGGRGSVWKSVNLSEQTVNEFKLKRDSLEPDMSLEEFIVQDIQELVQLEIEDGMYGLFNY
jgi:hypothetical protein|tara:strand:- start:135 stop:356 length:222 start_codon:yes stop_codon:yes gene_type:complete